jgi:hypothetical protein
MSTTAIGASFSFTSVNRIQASQPGRTKEAETPPETNAAPAAGSYLDIAKSITAGSTVVQKTLVDAQQQSDSDNDASRDRVQQAAKAYGG